MRRPLPAIAALLLLATNALAAGGAGSNSLEFLNIGVGARYVAMGQSASSVVDDANALFWNPAGLGRMRSASATFMYGAYVASLQQQSLAIAAPMRLGTFGLSAQSLVYPSIRRTDDSGRETGRFSPSDTAYGIGWGHSIGSRTYLGLAAKMIQSKIVDTASTWAGDAGISYQRAPWGAAVAIRAADRRLRVVVGSFLGVTALLYALGEIRSLVS